MVGSSLSGARLGNVRYGENELTVVPEDAHWLI